MYFRYILSIFYCSRHEGSGPAELPGDWEEEQEEKP
jgi:hypothetical protein